MPDLRRHSARNAQFRNRIEALIFLPIALIVDFGKCARTRRHSHFQAARRRSECDRRKSDRHKAENQTNRQPKLPHELHLVMQSQCDKYNTRCNARSPTGAGSAAVGHQDFESLVMARKASLLYPLFRAVRAQQRTPPERYTRVRNLSPQDSTLCIPFSTISIPNNAPRLKPPRALCSSSLAPDRAKPASSPIASPGSSRRKTSRPTRSSPSPSPTKPPAKWPSASINCSATLAREAAHLHLPLVLRARSSPRCRGPQSRRQGSHALIHHLRRKRSAGHRQADHEAHGA